MVAYRCFAAHWRFDSNWWWLGYCTVYLYLVLIMEKHPNKSQVILTIVVGFLVLYAIFKVNWLLYVSLGIGVLGIFSDAFAGLVTTGWLKFAEVLGRINGNILLTVIFFIFLTPIALLMRIFKGADELHLKKQSGTNYATRNHKYAADGMKNIW